MSERGWFPDVDREQIGEYVWQPCLETGEGHIPSFEVWFNTEAECKDWIAVNVIGIGWYPGDEPAQPTADLPVEPEPDGGVV